MHQAGIVGASGYTGAELLRLLYGHPDIELAWATGDSAAGTGVADLYPSLAGAYPTQVFDRLDSVILDEIDLIFLALPHGAAQGIVPALWGTGPKVVDLSADFRLHDPALYDRWYGEAHTAPELLESFAYGLPELNRDAIAKADAVAAAGCYPTAAALALAPLVAAGVVAPSGIVVDAASGVSGAGRTLRASSHFGAANESYSAYGLLDHRHTPEIEQAVGAGAGVDVQVLFTPHLAPMTRGILATCYARPVEAVSASTDVVLEVLTEAYREEPFVVVGSHPPSTKDVWGSNAAHMTARFDPRTGWVVVLCAIDNLVKGASGQAVQCANLALGLDESAGLTAVGVYP